MPDSIRPGNQRAQAIPIVCLEPAALPAVLKKLTPAQQKTVAAMGFKAQAGAWLCLNNDEGLETVLFGLGDKTSHERTVFLPAKLASLLPEGTYYFAKKPDDERLAALAFALEGYRFDRYRRAKKNGGNKNPVLLYGSKSDAGEIRQLAEAICLGRDLINTPANDLGPEELSLAIKSTGKAHGAEVNIIKGAELQRGFPLIHAVGQGSARAPRLVELHWGKSSRPQVTLVGKGVIFDTGGLDIKPPSNMLLMKKDMGGAACALALAQLIMAARLKVNLRMLIPIVENAISGNSFRPGDIFTSRKGTSVEIGNTDAEGRLILADALTYAEEEKPDLLIDMATLTGAARVALGPDLPAYFTEDESLARDIEKAAAQEQDPMWRLPLYRRYASSLKSKAADLNNIGNTSFAGSIIAALFLAEFVSARSWLHIDLFAWNLSSMPGRPEGGECQSVRALFALLKKRYGRNKA